MTQQEYEEKLTEPQQKTLRRLYETSGPIGPTMSWEEFLSKCYAPSKLIDYAWIPNWNGMFVGIESNGYSHT